MLSFTMPVQELCKPLLQLQSYEILHSRSWNNKHLTSPSRTVLVLVYHVVINVNPFRSPQSRFIVMYYMDQITD